ncbi:Metallo-dependent phosphatase, partial [Trametes coccinea BRFM310]
RVVCVADTHNAQDDIPLPPGDILIHAGDLTTWGTEAELHKALRWLSAAPHPHKVFIAGNHDSALAIPERRDAILAAFPDLIYLEDTSVTITVHGRPLKLFGSPRTPRRGSGVFQYFIRSASWPIPPDTDILVTHGPPKFHLDDAAFGCNTLLAALWKIRPPLHVFGHIHDGRGVRQLDWSRKQEAYEASC